MLPPMDTTLLAANPKLETLYRDLCANRLNEDGSSRLDAKAVKERQALDEVSSNYADACLVEKRLVWARSHLRGSSCASAIELRCLSLFSNAELIGMVR